jgi:hypothetical protein
MSEEIVKSFIPSGKDSELIDVIKEDAIVSVKMSTGYYKRIQNVIAFLIEGKSVQEVQDSHKAIAARNITEPWIFQYETLLILCREFEKNAHENNFIEKITIAELREAMSNAEERLAKEDAKEREDAEKKQKKSGQ